MEKYNCLVVDDEPHALTLIESYVKQVPFLDLKGKCSNASDALRFISSEKIDLIYLDIQMPGFSGMDLATTLPPEIKIIFTTAFDNFALESYRVNALDYLLKPFSFQEFLTATRKIIKFNNQVTVTSKTEEVKREYLLIKADYKTYQLELNDILFFEGEKDYIKIYRKSAERPLMPLMSLKLLEEKLAGSSFMRVHRSYIVNLNNIEVIERNQIIFGKTRITVSEKYRDQFQQFLESR